MSLKAPLALDPREVVRWPGTCAPYGRERTIVRAPRSEAQFSESQSDAARSSSKLSRTHTRPQKLLRAPRSPTQVSDNPPPQKAPSQGTLLQPTLTTDPSDHGASPSDKYFMAHRGHCPQRKGCWLASVSGLGTKTSGHFRVTFTSPRWGQREPCLDLPRGSGFYNSPRTWSECPSRWTQPHPRWVGGSVTAGRRARRPAGSEPP